MITKTLFIFEMLLTQRAAFAATEGICEKKKREIKLEAPQKMATNV